MNIIYNSNNIYNNSLYDKPSFKSRRFATNITKKFCRNSNSDLVKPGLLDIGLSQYSPISVKQRKKLVCESEKLLKYCTNVRIKSKECGINLKLRKHNSSELKKSFEHILSRTGVKIHDETTVKSILDNGACLTGYTDGSYSIEIPENNPCGYEKLIKYNSDGSLRQVDCFISFAKGDYETSSVQLQNGEITGLSSNKYINGIKYITDNNFKENTRLIMYKRVYEKIYKKKLPDGCILNVKTNKIVKVNPDKITMESTKKDNSGWINLKDESGNILGHIEYIISDDSLLFSEFSSSVNGLGIGTRLINELKKIAGEKHLNLIAAANFEPGYGAGSRKPASNLPFYYKMGFKALDPGIDKLIKYCIENNLIIPISLNNYTKIVCIN